VNIAVPGGTGTLGRAVVEELVGRGHAVRVLSRRAPRRPPPGSTHHEVDLATGAGLDAALAGVDAVVDALRLTVHAASVTMFTPAYQIPSDSLLFRK
jgi:uncharacterized protein YbjT (DUF2867 family)